jgi:hypothetical protein
MLRQQPLTNVILEQKGNHALPQEDNGGRVWSTERPDGEGDLLDSDRVLHRDLVLGS